MSKPMTTSIAHPHQRTATAEADAHDRLLGVPDDARDSLPRRRFMRAAICAPAAAITATAARASMVQEAEGGPQAAAPAPCASYHETAHIRTYYDLAAY